MQKKSWLKYVTIWLLLFCFISQLQAQQSSDPLSDRNGDGVVSLACMGDSITFGVGDGTNPGDYVEFSPTTDGTQGYPKRIRDLTGLMVKNLGIPSERFIDGGLVRLPSLLETTNTDVLVIFEGANDAITRVSTEAYTRSLQQAINMSQSKGYLPFLATIPSPCCSRAGRELYTMEYSRIVRDRAAINQVPFADLELAWRTTCVDKSECELFNIPDGIHPNKRGYDVIAQTILASLYGIDIFSPGGAAELEGALGLQPGAVIVKPRQTPTATQE